MIRNFNFRPNRGETNVAPMFRPDAETIGAAETTGNSMDADERLWMLLSAYADGETTPEETAEVEAALRSDPIYARDLEFLRLTSTSVPHLAEIEPPASLCDAILARTSHRPTFSRRVSTAWGMWRTVLSPVPARYALSAGIMAAGLAAFLFWPRSVVHTIHPPIVTVNSQKSAPPSAAPSVAPTLPSSIAKTSDAPKTVKPVPLVVQDDNSPQVADAPLVEGTINVALANWKAEQQKAANAKLQTVRLTSAPRLQSAPLAADNKNNKTRMAANAPKRKATTIGYDNTYAVNPRMDDINVRMLNTRPSEDAGTTHDAPETAAPTPTVEHVAVVTPAPEGTPKVYNDVQSGRLIAAALSSIPADERYSRTNKELFASLNANKEGLPDDVRRSNERGSAQITLARLPLR